MAQHKWHKEIKAWADGAEIEFRYISNGKWSEWEVVDPPVFNTEEEYDYRIKPQPKEPKYLYVIAFNKEMDGGRFSLHDEISYKEIIVCKIKLEVEDETN
jgi:hypothetical protein